MFKRKEVHQDAFNERLRIRLNSNRNCRCGSRMGETYIIWVPPMTTATNLGGAVGFLADRQAVMLTRQPQFLPVIGLDLLSFLYGVSLLSPPASVLQIPSTLYLTRTDSSTPTQSSITTQFSITTKFLTTTPSNASFMRCTCA